MEVPHERYVTTFNNLPPLLRSYIVDGEISKVVADIGKTYSFHVDVTGQLEQQSIYMLMGLMSPAELLGELVLTGISSDTAKAVLDELNRRVFTPLQKKMRESGPVAQQNAPAAAALTQAQTPAKVTSETAPDPPPPAVRAVLEEPPVKPQEKSTPLVPMESLPRARTMASDMELASHGLQGQPATPARSFQTASVPVTKASTSAPPPQTAILPEYKPAPTAPVRLTPVDRTYQTAPITKEYGLDPYREPID
jgi:hypothetical protein